VVSLSPDPRDRMSHVAWARSVPTPGTQDKARAVRRTAAEHGVDLVMAEVVEELVAWCDGEAQLDLRMAPSERAERRGKHHLARSGHGTEPESSLLGGLDSGMRLLGQADDAAAVAGVHLSGWGDAQPPTLAPEQLRTQQPPELADGRRDGRLGDVQLGGCGAHRPGAHDGEERSHPGGADVRRALHAPKDTSTKG
jgi:hypothetical protein